jgi:hypothetical protein
VREWAARTDQLIVTRLRTGPRWDGGLISGNGDRFVSSPKNLEQFWDSHILLMNHYQGIFHRW